MTEPLKILSESCDEKEIATLLSDILNLFLEKSPDKELSEDILLYTEETNGYVAIYWFDAENESNFETEFYVVLDIQNFQHSITEGESDGYAFTDSIIGIIKTNMADQLKRLPYKFHIGIDLDDLHVLA